MKSMFFLFILSKIFNPHKKKAAKLATLICLYNHYLYMSKLAYAYTVLLF